MSHDIELQYMLMEAGRMNLMHLPSGAIAWLWDRPTAQVDAAEALAVAANQYGNPVVDASLLKADPNVMLIKCEGGECFRIYPDGGYSCQGAPMDIGGCSSILQGGSMEDCGCPMGDDGHMADPSPGDGYNDAMDVAVLDDIGNDEHMDTRQPQSGVTVPKGMTNLAGEPTMDEDMGGDWGGPGTSDGMGTGSPYVGDMDMTTSRQLANMVQARGIGEMRLSEDEIAMIAESLKLV